MDLLEYQGKQLFARHDIPVPAGRPATTLDEALDAADAIGYPCVIKAQVQIGGRGKLGGITRCDEVAKGLIEAFERVKPEVPFVVRLDGTNDEEGRRLLAEADLPSLHVEATMLGAAERVVELAKAGAEVSA